MAGISVCNVDTAGGIIRSRGNSTGFYKGNPIAVAGDPVDSHGKSPHNSAVMTGGSAKGFIKGKPMIMAGSKASCGHAATGQSGMSSSS